MFSICFTGHRPNKLGGYDWNSPTNVNVRNGLSRLLESAITKYPNDSFKFFFGGALGFDQMAFDVVYELKEIHKDTVIEMVVAVPFKDQPKKWFNREDLVRYQEQLELADEIVYVDSLDYYKRLNVDEGLYHPAKLQIRNEYMVDNSNLVIALWDGTKGGTANCVSYAKKLNKQIVCLNPNDFLES